MKVDIKDIDFFPATVIKIGTSMGVIIPANNVKFSGLADGDTIKVYYKKVK